MLLLSMEDIRNGRLSCGGEIPRYMQFGRKGAIASLQPYPWVCSSTPHCEGFNLTIATRWKWKMEARWDLELFQVALMREGTQ